ncbi:HERC4-like protein [Mya arenaria]|uniref:HERC4-like protein n=1 Tax=Mya arenaria TaxID=6604 RepID=A0ABY7DHH3_MYAAR|nr:HERC4-like protein [Mya arenaria]
MTSRIFCWGGNQNGQLGIGNLEEDKVTEPKVIKDALTDVSVSQIACGDKHTLFVLSNGDIYSCGNNDYGKLGHTKRTSRPEKIDALESQTVVQARAGMSHSLCLTTAGEVFSWGDNSYGQLGRSAPDNELYRTPKLIKFPHTVVQISCGRNHNLLLTDDGHLFSWGNNDCGQLGLGNTSNQSQPTQINSLPGVPIGQLACGGSHSFVLTKSGTVFSWGRNSYGQLGTSDNKDQKFPVLCKSLRTQQIMYITCGEDHTAALTRQGGLFMFGAGTYGQLGHGNKTHEVLPRKVLELMGSQASHSSVCSVQWKTVCVWLRDKWPAGIQGQWSATPPSASERAFCPIQQAGLIH